MERPAGGRTGGRESLENCGGGVHRTLKDCMVGVSIRLRHFHIARFRRRERESLVAGDVANGLEEALEI